MYESILPSAKIEVTLSVIINRVQACTIFALLNRLEKSDGSLNDLFPKWDLILRVPVGGRKGLYQWEMLIQMLYPWISITETSSDEIVPELEQSRKGAKEQDDYVILPSAHPYRAPAQATPKQETQPNTNTQATKKPFWKRFLGLK